MRLAAVRTAHPVLLIVFFQFPDFFRGVHGGLPFEPGSLTPHWKSKSDARSRSAATPAAEAVCSKQAGNWAQD
jgi:hypothetical protein